MSTSFPFSDRLQMEGTTRFGIDLHVVDGKFQGSRTHVIELFSRLILISPDLEFFLFLDKPQTLPELSPAFASPNVHCIRMRSTGSLKRLYWDLPMLSRANRLTAIHSQYVVPAPVAIKRFVTIHDILFESNPEYFTRSFVARSKVFIAHAAKHSDHIFTVSEFSKREISSRYNVPENRISVIYNGVNYERFAFEGREDAAILANRGLEKANYLLSVGRLEPRKNHEALIKAYRMLGNAGPPLVLVGQSDFRCEHIFTMTEQERRSKRIIIIDDASDMELPALYRHASAFIYPTLAEGFGMPVLEAMAAGVPVVTSDRAAIPEIADHGTALLVNPTNLGEMASAIREVLLNDSLRSTLTRAAQIRAKTFEWEKAAQLVRGCYVRHM